MREYEVPPYTDFEVPGTALVVYHQGDEEGWVHVDGDGDVELCSPFDWWIRDGKTGIRVAGEVLGGGFDMAVKARAAWLAHTEGWSPDDEPIEDLTKYEARYEERVAVRRAR